MVNRKTARHTSHLFARVVQPSSKSVLEYFLIPRRNLIPISSHSLFLPTPNPRLSAILCLYRFACSGHFLEMESYGMTNFFHVAKCFQVLCMSKHVSLLSFLWLTYIPSYEFATWFFFISWWTFRWFPLFAYYETCDCEHLSVSFWVNICFHLSWAYTEE